MGLAHVPQVLAVQGADDPVERVDRWDLRPIPDAIQRLARDARAAREVGQVRPVGELLAEFLDGGHVLSIGHKRPSQLGQRRDFLSDTVSYHMPDTKSPRLILADNLAQLVKVWSIKNDKPHEPVVGYARAHKIPGNSALLRAFQRAYDGGNLTLKNLEAISAKLGCEVWKLLHPNFTPDGKGLMPTEHSPHATRLAKKFDALPSAQAKLDAFALIDEVFDRIAAGEAPVPSGAPSEPQTQPEPPAALPSPAPKPTRARRT